VLRQHRPLDGAADEAIGRESLEPRDAAFARAIAATALRRFGQLEDLIRGFVPKSPPAHKAGATLDILVLGAAELLFLGVAPHAVVDAANRLAAADPKALHFKGLINAVLRRVAREGAAIAHAQDAVTLNASDWLWRRWCASFGEETARKIGAVHLQVPPLDLTLKREDDPLTGFERARVLAPGRLRLEHAGRVETLPGFSDGRWWVQDFAASLPARLLGGLAGQHVIDLCAAPGGKTLQFAAQGARVTAVDLVADRAQLIGENCARTGLAAEVVLADVRDWRPAEPAPFVLLDAPCTASGTIRRHPDLPWLKSAADLGICEALQSELLEAASEMVAPGGLLVYAVCSLEPEEGVEQVELFLRDRMDFTRAPISAAEVFDPIFVTPEGDLRTLPCYWADHGGMDGFYAARLVRKLKSQERSA
jgi:16S rRNA (cytosine967-C5)-methyltransferase